MRALCATITFFFLVFTASAWANACASAGSGPWATAGTWATCGGGVPGNGDTASIGTGHAVTIGGNVTVGTSGASGTTSITVTSTGSLTVNAGFTLVSRGDVVLNNAGLTLAQDSIFEFDASQATTPLSQHYKMHISTAHNQSNARLAINGASGHRVTVRSNASGGNGTIDDGTGPWLNGGAITGTYFDFLRIGDASNPILFSVNSGGVYSISNFTFDSCGKLTSTYNNSADGTNTTIQHGLFKNTAATETMRILGNTSYTSGTRLIDDNVFDKLVEFYTGQSYTITNNQFYAGFDVTDAAWTLFDSNLVYKTSATETKIAASVSNDYWVIDGAVTNPHFLQPGPYARNFTVDGEIFEFTGTDGTGDCVLTPSTNPASAITVTVQNCIELKNGGTDDSGTMVTFFGGQPNVSVTAKHNTFYAGSQGFAVQETGAGTAGTLVYKDNVAWDDATARGFGLFDSGTNDNTPDLVTSVNADYNCHYDILAGSNLKGYDHLEFSSGSPGAHDQTGVNPTFVDALRRIAAWDTSLSGPGTVSHAIAELKKKNDPSASFNASFTILNLRTYVRNGFKVRNAALNNAASDGTVIGCCGYLASSNVSANLLMMGAD